LLSNKTRIMALLSLPIALMGCPSAEYEASQISASSDGGPSEVDDGRPIQILDPEVAALRADTENAYQEIQEMIDIPECDIDADCEALALGKLECGGPQAYLIASSIITDIDVLKEKIKEYDALSLEYQKRVGTLSPCVFIPIAEPGCVQNKCTNLNSPLVLNAGHDDERIISGDNGDFIVDTEF